jgi:hypothetical protein
VEEEARGMTARHQFGLCVAIGLYLLGLGFLGGMVAERMRFDQERTAVLDRYNDKIREWHQFRMLIERQAVAYPSDGTGDPTTPFRRAARERTCCVQGQATAALGVVAFPNY